MDIAHALRFCGSDGRLEGCRNRYAGVMSRAACTRAMLRCQSVPAKGAKQRARASVSAVTGSRRRRRPAGTFRRSMTTAVGDSVRARSGSSIPRLLAVILAELEIAASLGTPF